MKIESSDLKSRHTILLIFSENFDPLKWMKTLPDCLPELSKMDGLYQEEVLFS